MPENILSGKSFGEHNILIPVPSGRLVFANDMRALTGHVRNYDVNTELGIYAMSVQYGYYGVGHIFVGNSSPCVIQDGDELHVVANTDKEDLGAIDTSLWWYSAMDADLFEKRCVAFGIAPDLAAFDAFVVDVKPGVHAFTWENADSDVRDAVLSRISWTNVAIEDVKQVEPDFSPSASFVKSRILQSVANLPYPVDDVAEGIFTLLGDGFRWHHGQLCNISGHDEDERFAKRLPKTGATQDVLDRIPALPDYVPGIRGSGRCYPLSETYPKLGSAPLNADPNDLALGMMVAKSLILSDFEVIGASSRETGMEENKAILLREIAVADKIAQTRGLWKDGTMDRIFGQITAVWNAAKSEPEPEEGLGI